MNPQGEVDDEFEDEDYEEDGEEGDIEYVDGDDVDEEEMEGDIEEDEEDDEVGPLNEDAPYIRGLEPVARRSPAGTSAQSSKAQQQPAQPWKGLGEMPVETQKAFKELLQKLQSKQKNKLTVLVLGKSQVGKSSLINKLLNERPLDTNYGQQPRGGRLQIISREAAGFTLNLIDTPGLPEDGTNAEAVLKRISADLRGRQVDAVLYVDRLDAFRVDAADTQNMEAISSEFGSAFWNQAIITFTHARITSLPDNLQLGDLLHQRGMSLRSAIRKASGNKTAALPQQAVECGWRCDSDDQGVKILPDGTRWLSALMNEVVNTAHKGSWKFDKAQRQNPDRKFCRWIPLVLAAQLAVLKLLVIDRVLSEDGVKGDQWGPYDDKVVRLERRRKAQAKEQERAAKSAARSTASTSSRRQPQIVEDDDDFDDL
ncbi:hypothetical protein WJX73_002667 [Symbiochloris irregularis]|uniref:AIG1-type G domain-containing protein n=1 Tax=Symbiochloris irregularis TaxID=706552 RepID=A0AAW1P243_9CHLO